MKNKILFIIPTLGKGGAERIIYDFINNLVVDAEINLLLLFNTYDSDFIVNSLRVTPFYLFKKRISQYSIHFKFLQLLFLLFLPFWSLYLFIKLKVYSYNLIVYNLIFTGLLSYGFKFLSVAKRNTLLHLEIFHSNLHLFNLAKKAIFLLSFLNKDYIVSNISKEEQFVLKKYFPNKKIYYLPFSVHIKETKIVNLFKQDNIIRITTLSRLVKVKNIDFFLKVCHKLALKGIQFQFDIYGDGPERKNLQNMIHSLGLEDFVSLKGSTSDPLNVLRNYDFFFCAMVGDSTGIAGIQAAFYSLIIMGYQTLKNYKPTNNDALFSSNLVDSFVLEIERLSDSKYKDSYKNKVISYFNEHSFTSFIMNYSSLFNQILKKTK